MHQKVTIWVNYHHTEEVQRGNGRVCFSGNGCTYSSNEYDDEFLEQILKSDKKKEIFDLLVICNTRTTQV